MKKIKDQQSGQVVTINYVASSATATMCCNEHFIKAEIPRADRSMCQIAYTKSDLESFGSFFNLGLGESERRDAA